MVVVSLLNSNICRICANVYNEGFGLFEESEDKASLVLLINKYLPITIINDGIYPTQICERCHMGVAATVDLIDRMVEGQQSLRALLKVQAQEIDKSNGRPTTDPVLFDLQGSSQPVPMDDVAEGEAPVKLYGDDHSLTHSVSGTILKRKRGRPKKLQNVVDDKPAMSEARVETIKASQPRPKRSCTMPLRYRDTVAGDALEDLMLDASAKARNISGPSIEVAGDGNATDLPFALNIEIIEQDGHIILHGIERLGEVQQFRNIEPTSETGLVTSNDSYPSLLQPLLSLSVPDDSARHSSETVTLSNAQQSVTLSTNNNSIRDKCVDKILYSIPSNDSTIRDGTSFESLGHGRTALQPRVNNEQTNVKNLDGNDVIITLPSTESKQTAVAHKNNTSKEMLLMSPIRVKKNYHKKSRYKCQICSQTFLREGRYLHHMILHGDVTLHCGTCSQAFTDHNDLQNHQLHHKHTGVAIEEKPSNSSEELRCSVCPNRVFVSRDGYEKHMASTHSNKGKPLQCEHCFKGFVYSHSLRAHLQCCPVLGAQDITSDREYNCQECGKVFRHLSSLNYHLDSAHNPGRVFVCTICGVSFKHRQLLQRHRVVHSDERPYECGTCGKKFKTRCNLINHAATHRTEKRYTCEHCGKQFNHITSITLHLKSHRGDKQYSCEYCGKSFVQKTNLREHVRIHTGEKPFACEVCGKKFTTSSQVRFHSRVHNKSSVPVYKEKKSSKQSSKKSTSSTKVLSTDGKRLLRFCSRCEQILPEDEDIEHHRCPEVLSGTVASIAREEEATVEGNQQWLMTAQATPAEHQSNASVTLNSVGPNDGNVIYLLSSSQDKMDGNSAGEYSVLQQDGVSLVEHHLATVDQCWTRPHHATSTLQLYEASGSSQLLPSLTQATSIDAATQPLQDCANSTSVKGSKGVTLVLPH